MIAGYLEYSGEGLPLIMEQRDKLAALGHDTSELDLLIDDALYWLANPVPYIVCDTVEVASFKLEHR